MRIYRNFKGMSSSTQPGASNAAPSLASGRARRTSLFALPASSTAVPKSGQAGSGRSAKPKLATPLLRDQAELPLAHSSPRHQDAVGDGQDFSGDGAPQFSGRNAHSSISGYQAHPVSGGFAQPLQSGEGAHNDEGQFHLFSPQVQGSLENVLAASPIVQALSASVHRSREALDVAMVSLAEAGSADEQPKYSEQNQRVIASLEAQVSAGQRQLDQAIKVESDRFGRSSLEASHGPPSARSSRTPVQHRAVRAVPVVTGPMDRYLVPMSRHAPPLPRAQAVTSSVSRSHAASASLRQAKQLRNFERQRSHFFDEEERQAIADGDDIQFEARSQDSVRGRHVDVNGYEPDDFVAPDDEDDELLFSDDDMSTDDNSCTTDDDDVHDVESDSEETRRMEAIAQVTLQSKTKGITLSASGAALSALRAADVYIRRRTSRSHLLDLILNHWLRCDLTALSAEHVAEFLKQVRYLKQEYAISVYYILCKRIRPISLSFFKFLYRCIAAYLPSHKNTFARAYRDVIDKEAKNKPVAAPASDAADASSKEPAKPTLKAPTIHDITDIATAVGRFHNEYRAYRKDHQGRACKTLFRCLNPDQATTFAAMTLRNEDELDKMSDDEVLEVWKTTFGLKSSASVLSALSALQFRGDPMLPATWADWFKRFLLVKKQAPLVLLPPEKVMAKRFIMSCPSVFLRSDVLAMEPETITDALRVVLSRLNDSGFLR